MNSILLPMPNIRILRDDLRANGWHMTSFLFNYNKSQYIVLFEDIDNLPIQKEKCIAYITFLDKKDITRSLSVKANTYTFKVTARVFRDFFEIEYGPSLGDVFKTFYRTFNSHMPKSVPASYSNELKRIMTNRLSNNDKESTDKIYCYRIGHNPIVDGKQRMRTVFNSDKTRLLRPQLFEIYKSDPTISFFYREFGELSDEEIMENFARKH